MAVTTDLVEAFLKCPTKCFLRARAEIETGNAYADWVRTESDVFRCQRRLKIPHLAGRKFPTQRPPANAGCRVSACPLSLILGTVPRTARSGQGRAGFARRSGPLTARTVLKDGNEGKGAGSQGHPPRGLGQRPRQASLG